jgi:hypothetical protein
VLLDAVGLSLEQLPPAQAIPQWRVN